MGRHADREQPSNQNNGRNGVKDGKSNQIDRDTRVYGRYRRSNVPLKNISKKLQKRIQGRSGENARGHNDNDEDLQRNRLQERGAIK